MTRKPVLFTLFSAIYLLSLAAPAAALERAYLRTNVVVETDTVLLGDIFDGAGEYADKVIAYAPSAGRKLILEATWLQRVARAYRVAWRPSSRSDRSVVERRSHMISTEAIRDSIAKSILSRTRADGDLEIELDNPTLKFHLPHDMPPRLTAQAVSYDDNTGRFSVQIVAPDDRPGAVRAVVTGQVHKLIQLPVLARRLERNEVIGKRDVAWKTVRAGYVGSHAVRDIEELVGLSPRRPIAPDRAIRANDLQPPILVERGKLVTIWLKTATMQLSATGKALQSGALGDTVRIQNTGSGTILEAVVTGDNQVSVARNNTLASR